MNSKSTLFTNIIILAAGVLLCYVHARDNIINQIILITGITLAVPGVINLILLNIHDKDEKHRPTSSMKVAGWISGAASVGLGLLMIILPGLFTPVLVYIFGFLLIMASLILLYLMIRALKANAIAGWVCIGPGLVLITGVIMICLGQPAISDAMVALITGISMIVYSVSWFISSIMLASHRRHVRKAEITTAALATKADSASESQPKLQPAEESTESSQHR